MQEKLENAILNAYFSLKDARDDRLDVYFLNERREENSKVTFQ